MLDFNHVLATPGADIQYFQGPATTTLLQWQVWRKPRGAKWIHMIGVGGGGGGGTGINTTTSSGGGAGGSSGGQTVVTIPAMMVPDILYIQAGRGGPGATASGGNGSQGLATYVCIAPFTTVAVTGTILFASAGTSSGGAATSTNGGTAPGAVTVAAIANMCIAGRGFYTFYAGQIGASGGASTVAGTNLTPPVTGLMVTGGAGGGGCGGSSSAGFAGGNINVIPNMLGTDFFPLPLIGGTEAVTSTPATASTPGFVSKNYLFNFGGAGGGGATRVTGGIAGDGGDGAPGCGGGGGGGQTTVNPTVARGGNGGPGFVYIITT